MVRLRYRPGFQSRPDLQQVQVLRRYSTFWAETTSHGKPDLKKIHFWGQIYHVKWFQPKKLNTRGELELAANQAEPENQAGPVPGTDHD